ncbi:MAG: septum formation initiator family protein [Patescibacteria group bacterium]
MVANFKKKQKNRYSANIVFFVFAASLMLTIILLLVFKDIGIYKKKEKLNSEFDNIKKQIQETIKKNQELKQGISQSNSIDYLEKVAREQLNLQKQGEKVVSFILPQQQPKNEDKQQNFMDIKIFTGWFSSGWDWIKSRF